MPDEMPKGEREPTFSDVVAGEFVEAGEESQATPKEEGAGETVPVPEADEGKAEDWQRFVDAAKKLPQGSARHGLYDHAREVLVTELNRAVLSGDDKRIAEIAEKLDEVYGLMETGSAGQKKETKPGEVNLVEIQRQSEYVINPMNFPDIRKQRAAAQRWLGQFAGKPGITKDIVDGVRDVLSLEPGKVSEVEMSEETKESIEIDIRMAMIEELAERAHANMDVAVSFGSFILAQARKYGYGKTRFPKTYEDEFKNEYLARAELAAISSFWDGIAGQLSADSDPYKDMSVGKIDSCLKLSRDSYKWLTGPGRKLKYREDDGGEREVPDFRVEMDKAANLFYGEMINRRLNLWKVRGEDKIAKITEYANTSGIDFDALILMWNLADAECWQAKIQQGFFNHPAFRLVKPSEQRDFQSRQGWAVTGGNRLWVDRRRKLKGGIPAETELDVYNDECIKLAKVGFESWTKFVPKLDSAGNQEVGDDGKLKFITMPDLLSGEQALGGGNYLELLGVMVRHVAFVDDFLPQKEVMTSISKGAAAWAAIEAIGKTEPKQLAPKMLSDIRNKMELALFRLKEGNSADLRMEAARQETGRHLLEWSKTFLWLPSWDNPAHDDETTVATAANWLDLFQAVVTAYNSDAEWGEYIGYGMGRINYVSGLAVDSQVDAENKDLQVKTRTGPTAEAKKAARSYLEWFDKLEETHAGIARGKDRDRKPFVTESRKKQDDTDLSKYKVVYWMTSAPMPGFLFGSDRRWWLRKS